MNEKQILAVKNFKEFALKPLSFAQQKWDKHELVYQNVYSFLQVFGFETDFESNNFYGEYNFSFEKELESGAYIDIDLDFIKYKGTHDTHYVLLRINAENDDDFEESRYYNLAEVEKFTEELLEIEAKYN